MKVFIVYGQTESGDDWTMVFNRTPSKEEILSEIKKNDWLREEWEAECIQGWSVVEETVVELGDI